VPLITLLLGLSAPYVAHGQGDYTLSASEVTAPHAGRLRPIWSGMPSLSLRFAPDASAIFAPRPIPHPSRALVERR
jgi:hypothetical protein